MLRVIGGKHRSRILDQPPLKTTRPTTDRTKEAVFSMIQFQVEGSVFLDLFSGSGSIGIEAASRGAAKVIGIEQSMDAINIINKNLKELKINNMSVFRNDVISYIRSSKGRKFDFIFMDPPYKSDLYNETIQAIADSELLKENGLLIVETSRSKEITIPEGLVLRKEKRYGKSSILIIANNI